MGADETPICTLSLNRVALYLSIATLGSLSIEMNVWTPNHAMPVNYFALYPEIHSQTNICIADHSMINQSMTQRTGEQRRIRRAVYSTSTCRGGALVQRQKGILCSRDIVNPSTLCGCVN